MPPITVALIDRDNLFREGLSALVADLGIEIACDAAGLNEARSRAAAAAQPDLVLIDPAGCGPVAQAVGACKAEWPEARVVLLTAQLDAGVLATAIQAGADGFLTKDLSTEALGQSLRLVLMGEKVFPSHLAALLIGGRSAGFLVEPPVSNNGLSARETQIVRCLLGGDSNKAIAIRLGITEATVKVHLKSLLRKINASNRTQAAIWAMNHGYGGNLLETA